MEKQENDKMRGECRMLQFAQGRLCNYMHTYI